MTPFYVGQKVVCVDAAGDSYLHITSGLSEGAIYTIAGFEKELCPVHWDAPAVFLAEVKAPHNPFSGIAMAFLAARFRPVVNTDISIFTAMLKTTKQGADA